MPMLLPQTHPVVAQPGGGTEEDPAVGRMRDGAADHALDAGLREGGNAAHGESEAGLEAIEIGRQQLHVEAPVDAVEAPGAGVLHLVGPDQQPPLLLPVVARRARVADDRRLPLQRHQLRHLLGDQVLVDHVDDGNPEADHGAHLRREGAGGVDHVLRDDGAGLGDHGELTARPAARPPAPGCAGRSRRRRRGRRRPWRGCPMPGRCGRRRACRRRG